MDRLGRSNENSVADRLDEIRVVVDSHRAPNSLTGRPHGGGERGSGFDQRRVRAAVHDPIWLPVPIIDLQSGNSALVRDFDELDPEHLVQP